MPQDLPATDAGTDKTRVARPRLVKEFPEIGELGETIRFAGNGSLYQWRNDLSWHEVADAPDTWAPVNRRTLRDDVDRFRNLRMPVPATGADALRVLALSLEYYEHATEVETRTKNALAELDAETDTLRDGCVRAIMSERDPGNDVLNVDVFKRTGGRYSKSQTGAKELAEIAPAMLEHFDERRKLAAKKAEAEKELGVARRRHATAITYANAFIFALSNVEMHGIGGTDAAARPDVTAGDTDRATLSEA